MAQRLIPASFVLSALLSHAALAQALGDPMRPPAGTTSLEEAKQGETGGSRLQSVLISPTRRVAVIDGRTVTLGQRFGDATVIAIAESEVTLQRGAERQKLKLHPGIEKRPVPWKK